MRSDTIVFIVGPTAVGKSAVSFKIAQKLNGEIISCDSMQVYKEINIASNKPSHRETREIPHHLIDIISVNENFDVATFNQLALNSIKDIHARKKIPIVVGGSPMYMQVLLDGIFKGPGKDPDLRGQLRQEAEEQGVGALYQKLQSLDMKAAIKIHPNDVKKVIRALEVCLKEKEPISRLQKKRKGLWGKYDIFLIGLNMNRERLYERINARVDEMFERGLIDEVKDVVKVINRRDNPRVVSTVFGMIGIKEVMGYLNGEYDLQTAKEKIKQNTRHFAKRQMTWYRKEKRIQWIMIEEGDTVDRIIKEIEKKIM